MRHASFMLRKPLLEERWYDEVVTEMCACDLFTPQSAWLTAPLGEQGEPLVLCRTST